MTLLDHTLHYINKTKRKVKLKLHKLFEKDYKTVQLEHGTLKIYEDGELEVK